MSPKNSNLLVTVVVVAVVACYAPFLLLAAWRSHLGKTLKTGLIYNFQSGELGLWRIGAGEFALG